LGLCRDRRRDVDLLVRYHASLLLGYSSAGEWTPTPDRV
jgi:hypothetical protein